MTRSFPRFAPGPQAAQRLVRAIIPALLAVTLLAACRSGSATPTATAPTATAPAATVTVSRPTGPGSPTPPPSNVAAATPTLARPGTPIPATPVVVTQTEVITIKPVAPTGLAPGLNRSESIVGYCIAPSLTTPARSDAWQCVANNTNQIYDPCFAASAERQPALFCFRQPWVSNVSLMVLNAPLPEGRQEGGDPTTGFPWGFELADGERCTIETTTTTMIAGQRVTATCTNSRYTIGAVDRSQPAWTIHVVQGRDGTPQRIQIVRAWY